jgi:Cu(I)/Ag(I) efflux system membrane fusion protein
LVALDVEARIATIRHDALDSLDWPAMISRFPVRADVALDRLSPSMTVAFRAVRGADGLLGLLELGSDDGIAATGNGRVTAVTADGKLSLSHDPIPELGWPAMQMDMPVAGFDPATVPLDAPVEFDLSKGEDGLFTIVAVRADGMGAAPAMEMAEAMQKTDETPPIIVSGTIDALDDATRTATITHGPITEIGMPGMTMAFAIEETLDPAALPIGVEAELTFARPDGMTMVLKAVNSVMPPMEVSGTINSVDTATGMANVSHGPMTEIGMPGMTMDFALDAALDPASLPLDTEVTLLLHRNPDFSMTLVGTRAEEDLQ